MEESYGQFIYKFGVSSLNKFFFFDYEEFLKSPMSKQIKDSITKYNLSIKNTTAKEPRAEISNTNYIQKQITFYGIKYTKELSEYLKYYPKDISDLAKRMCNSNLCNLLEKVDGLIFTSDTQGKVLVSYTPDIFIPMSYSKDNGKTWIKVNDKTFAKKVLQKDTFNNSKKDNPTHFVWKAKISEDAEFDIRDDEKNDDSFIWKKGTWKRGDWEYGSWEKGDWEYGTWNSGIWYNGTWHSGIWYGGTWEKGKWLGGYDGDGEYHPEGDSPDKW